MTWDNDLRDRFPTWGTDEAATGWSEVRATLTIGQMVQGVVVARAPFGVWLDIGLPVPALLLVPHMRGAKLRRITFDDYPALGTTVEASILALGNRGEISLLADHPEDDPWRDPSAHVIGTEFVGRVTNVLAYGAFVELAPGIEALLRSENMRGPLHIGDQVRVRVVALEPIARKVEVVLIHEGLG